MLVESHRRRPVWPMNPAVGSRRLNWRLPPIAGGSRANRSYSGQKSAWRKSHQIGTEKRASRHALLATRKQPPSYDPARWLRCESDQFQLKGTALDKFGSLQAPATIRVQSPVQTLKASNCGISATIWPIGRVLKSSSRASQPSFFQPPTTFRRISAMNREFCGRRPDEVAEARLYELQFWKIPLISLRIERHKTISLRQGMRSNDEIS